MYDELVKRLRERSVFLFPHHGESRSYDADLMHEAADAIEELSKLVDESIPKDDAEIIIAEVAKPRWIPVTERLPETGADVLVMFPHNMAVASRDMGEWVVNSGDGWCTDVNISDDEKEPTHWMPLPEPPKEEAT